MPASLARVSGGGTGKGSGLVIEDKTTMQVKRANQVNTTKVTKRAKKRKATNLV